MADYIVKDTELTSVANAIRTAGGTNSLLNFPNGFVSAVNNISGGSSDFSMAEVTIVCNIDHSGRVGFVPRQVEEGELGEGAPAMLYNKLDAAANSTLINKVVLYKGAASLTLDSVPSGISGAITNLSDNDYLITGDCTITIS